MFYKNKIEKVFLLMMTALSVTSATARTIEAPQQAAFDKCLYPNLFRQFAGDVSRTSSFYTQFNFGAETKVAFLTGDEFSSESTLLFLPGWKIDLVRNYPVGFEENFHFKATSSDEEDTLGLDMIFYGDSRGTVHLVIPSGLPKFTVDRHVKTACTVDKFGRDVCQQPVVTYSNPQVLGADNAPRSIPWVNDETNHATSFELDNAAYIKCLKAIQ